jgi:hypothetical protein
VTRVVTAALLYFAIVFAAGFTLGTIRVLWLEPRFGPTLAVLCEAPFLLAVMVVAARRIPAAVHLAQDNISLLLMGLGALALQQAAEFILGAALRGLSPSQQLAQFATTPGLIYAGLLMVFAGMPWLANRGGAADAVRR